MVNCIQKNPVVCILPTLAGLLISAGIVLLVIGILGTQSLHVIPMSAYASHVLISIGGGIIAVTIVKTCVISCLSVCRN